MSKEHKYTESRIISGTSILIISAFLIGITVGNAIERDLEPYVLATGLCGFVAFIGLEVASVRRKLQAVADEKRHIEDRLQRHVQSQSHGSFTVPPAESKSGEQIGAA